MRRGRSKGGDKSGARRGGLGGTHSRLQGKQMWTCDQSFADKNGRSKRNKPGKRSGNPVL